MPSSTVTKNGTPRQRLPHATTTAPHEKERGRGIGWHVPTERVTAVAFVSYVDADEMEAA